MPRRCAVDSATSNGVYVRDDTLCRARQAYRHELGRSACSVDNRADQRANACGVLCPYVSNSQQCAAERRCTRDES